MINWVTPRLGVGSLGDIKSQDVLEKNRIDAVLFLGDEHESTKVQAATARAGTTYRWYPVVVKGVDPPLLTALSDPIWIDKANSQIRGLLHGATKVLQDLTYSYGRVVVACTAGIDRSPFVAASVLVSTGKAKSLSEAYGMIRRVRPFIMEHYEWRSTTHV